MAERRMFAKTIIDSDAFMDMPLSTQALYFHLSMRADDEGFVNNPKKIQRVVGASEDDLKVLVAKRFILPFESGIVVIKHWRIHNYIKKDRFKHTVYEEERALIEVKENGSYTEKEQMYTGCIQNVYRMETQASIGKYSLDKNNISESNNIEDSHKVPSSEEIDEYIKAKNYSVNAGRFLAYYKARGWKAGKDEIHDWKALVDSWQTKEKETRKMGTFDTNEFFEEAIKKTYQQA